MPEQTAMASWMALVVIAVVGLVLLGAVVVLVLLLANPRTRVAGMVLSLLGLLGVVFVGVALLFVGVSRDRAVKLEETVIRDSMRAEQVARVEAIRRMESANRIELESRAVVESAATPESPAPGPTMAETEDADAATETPDGADATVDEPEPEETPEPSSLPSSPPSWLNTSPGRQSGAYQLALHTDPCETVKVCEAALPEVVQRGLAAYTHTELGFSPAIASRARLPWDYVQSHLIQEQWEQPVDTQSFGQWVELHVLVRIDAEAEDRIREQCKQVAAELAEAERRIAVHGRLWLGGTALAVVLGLLAVTFGYFKIDATTEGSYRWRLRMTAMIVIMGLIVGAFVCCA